MDVSGERVEREMDGCERGGREWGVRGGDSGV